MITAKRISLIVAGGLMVTGFLTWLFQIKEGLILTNMSNSYNWGLYVSGLAFFVGNAAGGLVLSSCIYLFGLDKLRPFVRLGALTAFANVTAALFVIIPDMGQPLRLHYMILYPQFNSPLLWDGLVMSAYAGLSLTYLYILMMPDLRGKMKKIAIGIKNQKQFSEKWAKRLAPIALVFAIGIHVVTAWIFSTQGGREWWFSPALAPDFLAVAISSGTSVVLMASVLAYGTNSNYKEAYNLMIKIIASTFFVHLFLMYNDFFIHAWYKAESSMHVFQIVYQDYLAAHLFEVIVPIIAIILLFIPKVRANAKAMIVSLSLLLLGVFTHRFMLTPPAFEAIPLTFPPLGLQGLLWSYPIASGRYVEGVNTFVNKWNYFPTWVEIIIFLGVLAYTYFIVAIAVDYLPIIKKEE
jgi:molybdopterin-containing oxidoreductase family membrane subunit